MHHALAVGMICSRLYCSGEAFYLKLGVEIHLFIPLSGCSCCAACKAGLWECRGE